MQNEFGLKEYDLKKFDRFFVVGFILYGFVFFFCSCVKWECYDSMRMWRQVVIVLK